MPLTDDAFAKIKAGTIRDNQITPDDILPFVPNQKIKMYFMSIAIDPKARAVSQGLFNEAAEKLLNGFCGKLKSYFINQNIVVTEMMATGWTAQGRKLCEQLLMKPTSKDEFGHPIYYLDILTSHLDRLHITSLVL